MTKVTGPPQIFVEYLNKWNQVALLFHQLTQYNVVSPICQALWQVGARTITR